MKLEQERIAPKENNLIVFYGTVSVVPMIEEILKNIFTGEKDDIYFEPYADDLGVFHITYYNPSDKEFLEPQYSDIEINRVARLYVVCREDGESWFPYHEIREALLKNKQYYGQFFFYDDEPRPRSKGVA